MAKTFREWIPEQSYLLPPSVLDWVTDHLVHLGSEPGTRAVKSGLDSEEL